VLEKEEFPLRLRFPVNSRNATFTEENWMLFRLRGRSGLAYRIWTGFQLTPEMHFLLPTFLFDIDITGGLQFSF